MGDILLRKVLVAGFEFDAPLEKGSTLWWRRFIARVPLPYFATVKTFRECFIAGSASPFYRGSPGRVS